MTAQEAIKMIGKEAVFTVDTMHVAVRIVDVRSAYGRIDYRIEPVTGSGYKWVSETTLNVTR